jgi:predicted glycosyltransferase involved in capsule biosynthesis
MQDEKSNVSIVVGCMNRTEFLIRALPSWLTHEKVGEIIIVDWNSSNPIENDIKHIEDDRIKVFRVIGVEKWLLSAALNFGINHSTLPLLLKLDSDDILRKDFFNKHPLTSNQNYFYTGNWQISRNENENHLNGVIYIPKKHFLEVGGYNEYIKTYGWDDSDLYERLQKNSLEKRDILSDHIFHLQHGDIIRSNFRDLKIEILKNMRLSQKRPWGKDKKSVSYIKIDDKKELYQPLDLDIYQIPYSLMQKCTLFALQCALNDVGYPWSMTNKKSYSTLVHLTYNRHRLKLFIEPKNGLGNRLRAIASAAVVAKETNRNLIIVWIPDNHCEAKFSDLFISDDLFYATSTEEVKYCFEEKITPKKSPSHSFADFYDTSDKPIYQLDFSTNKDIYIASACVLNTSLTNWSKESEWLKNNLRPVKHLEDEINHYSKCFDIANAIGVHVRMGQSTAEHSYEDSNGWEEKQRRTLEKSRKDSNYFHFMAEMEKIWENNPNQIFFLCADNSEIYEAFIKKYPNKMDKYIKYVSKTVYDRSTSQLQGALLDSYLLSKCKYVLGSPWSSFTELVARLGGVKILLAGKDFGTTKYGLLFYPGSYNIGDDIQSFAARQFLPIVDYYIDRDDQQTMLYDESGILKGDCNSLLDGPKKIKLIENGWYDGRLTKFPPHEKICPLFISFHLNEDKNLFSEHNYQVIKQIARLDDSMLNGQEKINYFKKYSPIGTRDIHTKNILEESGISAYHTCCLTLTLKPIFALDDTRTENIFIVDANITDPDLLYKLVPKEIIDNATYISHGLEELLPLPKKHTLAWSLLAKYQTAKLVITSRLHCALPCLAFGTPCLFLYSKMNTDPRFDDTLKKLLGDGISLPRNWNWNNPHINKSKLKLVEKISESLQNIVTSFVMSG